MKNIIKKFLPPIILEIRSKFLESKIKNKILEKKLNSNNLFDAQSEIFLNNIVNCKIYGEYGCGDSTSYVLQNYNIKIYSVDTSSEWIELVKKKNKLSKNLIAKYIDIGEVKFLNWGLPTTLQKRRKFLDYCNWLWEQEQKPDLVLVDGRFRVCSFLVSLKMGDPGTKIIFDDYVYNPQYHLVEEFIKPKEMNDRQALFIIPNKNELDLNEIDEEIKKFQYVTT